MPIIALKFWSTRIVLSIIIDYGLNSCIFNRLIE
jgi:hypothetical protein